MTEAKTLRDRCKIIADKIARDGMLRQGSAIDTILEFVLAERGRASDPPLEGTLPLVLYCGSKADRDGLIAVFREVHPNAISKEMP